MSLNRFAAQRIRKRLFGVVLAVEFDGETEVDAAEVCNEVRDRNLPPKLQVFEPAIAQGVPQRILGRGAVASEPAGNGCETTGHEEKNISRAARRNRTRVREPSPIGERVECAP